MAVRSPFLSRRFSTFSFAVPHSLPLCVIPIFTRSLHPIGALPHHTHRRQSRRSDSSTGTSFGMSPRTLVRPHTPTRKVLFLVVSRFRGLVVVRVGGGSSTSTSGHRLPPSPTLTVPVLSHQHYLLPRPTERPRKTSTSGVVIDHLIYTPHSPSLLRFY